MRHAHSRSQLEEQQQLSVPPRFTRSPKCSRDDVAAAAAAVEVPTSRQNSWKAWRLKLLGLLDSPGTSWLLMLMTLFVIFQEDFKYAVMPPSADLGFEIVTLIFLLLFLIEIGEQILAYISTPPSRDCRLMSYQH